MSKNKLKWYIADNDYVNYLRKYDNKVENIDYDEFRIRFNKQKNGENKKICFEII